MATVDCKKCNGRGLYDVPARQTFKPFQAGDSFRTEKCSECNGTGKIELRCTTWEGSDEREKLLNRNKELVHENGILKQGIKNRVPHLDLIALMEQFGITDCTIKPEGLAELQELWSNGMEFRHGDPKPYLSIRSVKFHLK